MDRRVTVAYDTLLFHRLLSGGERLSNHFANPKKT